MATGSGMSTGISMPVVFSCDIHINRTWFVFHQSVPVDPIEEAAMRYNVSKWYAWRHSDLAMPMELKDYIMEA